MASQDVQIIVEYENGDSFGSKRKRSDSVLRQNPLHQQEIKKAKWQHKHATKMFDYTAIADRLRAVSRSNSAT